MERIFISPRRECLVEFSDFIWLTVDGKSNGRLKEDFLSLEGYRVSKLRNDFLRWGERDLSKRVGNWIVEK